ncbi:MAG TPA: geranyl transferase, partial [Acholeplasmatales bacterium]|nr:geranyl transferase [Acholeplasmatales bacterium]
SGSDARNRKLTYASLLGVEAAGLKAEAYLRSALANLRKVRGDRKALEALAALAAFACRRDN